jgi:hypothetical protein
MPGPKQHGLTSTCPSSSLSTPTKSCSLGRACCLRIFSTLLCSRSRQRPMLSTPSPRSLLSCCSPRVSTCSRKQMPLPVTAAVPRLAALMLEQWGLLSAAAASPAAHGPPVHTIERASGVLSWLLLVSALQATVCRCWPCSKRCSRSVMKLSSTSWGCRPVKNSAGRADPRQGRVSSTKGRQGISRCTQP